MGDFASFYLAPRDGEPLSPYRPGQFLACRISVPEREEPTIRSDSLADSKKPDMYRETMKLVAQEIANQIRGR